MRNWRGITDVADLSHRGTPAGATTLPSIFDRHAHLQRPSAGNHPNEGSLRGATAGPDSHQNATLYGQALRPPSRNTSGPVSVPWGAQGHQTHWSAGVDDHWADTAALREGVPTPSPRFVHGGTGTKPTFESDVQARSRGGPVTTEPGEFSLPWTTKEPDGKALRGVGQDLSEEPSGDGRYAERGWDAAAGTEAQQSFVPRAQQSQRDHFPTDRRGRDHA